VSDACILGSDRNGDTGYKMRRVGTVGSAVSLNYQAVYIRKSSSLASTRFHVVAGLVLFAALATKVWVALAAKDYGYSLAHERSLTVELDMERRELELQRSILLRADTLAIAAKKKVALEDHDPARTIRIAY
jgi:hypothetical protein